MSLTLPRFRVGEPSHHEPFSVFPLFADPVGHVEYCLAEEALSSGTAIIKEVSEAGSVPDLLVENRGINRILLLEGEELKGGKQNRILNTSVLVAACTKLKIPVSCVEQGRWQHSGRHFQSSGHQITAKMRRAVKASVSESLQSRQGHRADQSKVWSEITELHSSLSLDSETSAMSDAIDAYEDRISEYHKKLNYVDGAVQNKAGRIASYCMWSEGVDSLLPKTDQIFFFRPSAPKDKQLAARGEWDHVRSIVGELMDPQDTYPERWRVREFPSEAMLEQIGTTLE